MRLIIEQEKKGIIEILPSIPPSLRQYLVPHAIPVAIEGDNFRALWQEFRGNGFSAWYSHYWTTGNIVLKAKGDEAILELRIALRSIIRGTWDKMSMAALPRYHFQMNFTPHVLTRAVFDSAREYETFDIHFEPSYLEKLGFDYKELEKFISSIYNHNMAELTNFPHHCTPRMIDYIHDIFDTRYSEPGKQRVLEDAVKSILFEALEAVSKDSNEKMQLRSYQVEQLHAVKALIEADCPLYRGNDKLMEAVGLNEYLFHVGFKQLFNTTPKDYYQDIRLMMARDLLRRGLPVNQVAHQLEYTSASPFIERFKAKFGYTPKEFQLRKL